VLFYVGISNFRNKKSAACLGAPKPYITLDAKPVSETEVFAIK
jgi:hypothetical protein